MDRSRILQCAYQPGSPGRSIDPTRPRPAVSVRPAAVDASLSSPNARRRLRLAGSGRLVEDDAPQGLRQEFIDAAFHIFGPAPFFGDRRLYDIVGQSLGVALSRQPYAGFRHASG